MKQKQKTRKAAAKRFKVTGTGKVLRYNSRQRHLLEHESSKVKRNRRGPVEVSSADLPRVKSMLPGI